MSAFSCRLAGLILLTLVIALSGGSSAYASEPPLTVLDEPSIELENFPIEYVVTEPGEAFAQVRSKQYTHYESRLALGTDAKSVWLRFRLHNSLANAREVFVHFPEAYHNRAVGFYEVRGGQLTNTAEIDLNHATESPYMVREQAVYATEIGAGETITLYVHSWSYSHQWFEVQVYDEAHSRDALAGTMLDIALMVGILLALIIFNFLLYISARSLDNVFYALYLISGALWIALSYGLLGNMLGLFGEVALQFHLSLMTMAIFLILFMTAVFDTRKSFPREHKVLLFLLVILVADLIYGLFDMVAALSYASSIAALMIVLTLSVGISIWRKGHPLAKFFLLGHSFFFIFNALAVLYYKSILDFSYITKHGVGIGIMLEALMLAFIVAYRIKMLEQIKASEQRLRIEAQTDSLTLLHNRRYFYRRANELLEKARAQSVPMAVLAIDIDDFKQVNDHFGHQVGDQVLVKLAELLRTSCRSNDVVARFGGEEFVVLLYRTSLSSAEAIAQTLRLACKEMQVNLSESQELSITVSIGVAEVDLNISSIELALHDADTALYQAKGGGRDRVVVYGESPELEMTTESN
ncbi:diguanylate cyclase [Pseudidiomarina insulisalsae]|uniref:diguanylate cyclase n=1 Tax=Pseudidiomarina insulisalsae TaxID=575789 RepID=A0A432YCM4_9GAMM|nr:diguanylate cyclase [Pseudidiomarina insulisalsae]RUO58729.1 GGDEF domain-containing protein [Pseudidiomarina insulisalsae]